MGRRMKWLVVFIALVTLWAGRLAIAESSESGASKKQGAHASNPTAQEPEFAGAAACAMCHEAETSSFGRNPHSKMVLAHGGKGVTCEGCHGSAKEHVEAGGDITKIFSFSHATAEQVQERCLTCHQGDHEAFQRSAHAEAKVVCTSCHSVHAAQNDPQLLKASQQTLCESCHKDVSPPSPSLSITR